MRRQEEEGEEEGDSDCEIQQLKQKIRLRRQQIRRSRLPPCTSSQHREAALIVSLLIATLWFYRLLVIYCNCIDSFIFTHHYLTPTCSCLSSHLLYYNQLL